MSDKMNQCPNCQGWGDDELINGTHCKGCTSKAERAYLYAVGNRCSISDNSACVRCDAVSKACRYIHVLEAANTALAEQVEELKVKLLTMAMLASDKPGFFNPAGAMLAKEMRDVILYGKQPRKDGK
jgi:hypothetical protein